MLRTISIRAAHKLPAALAVALIGFASSAFADVAARLTDLNAKLLVYAGQENKASTVAKPYDVVGATADDLVFAVYELAQALGDNPQDLADLAQAALTALPATNGNPASARVRADKDKIVGRIVEAALVASSTSGPNGSVPQDQADIVDKLVQQVGAVNSAGFPASKQLTAAGKQLLVAKALRSSIDPLAATKAAQRAAAFYTTTGTTAAIRDTARTTFNVAVLKLLAFKPITNDPALSLPTKGTYFPVRDGAQIQVKGEPAFVEGTPPSVFNVREYIDAILDGYEQTNYKASAATNIAAGVAATVPAAAGSAIAGYLKDANADNAAILNFLKSGQAAIAASGTTPKQAAIPGAVVNAKLAAAVSDIVADSFRLLSGSTHVTEAVNLATAVAATPGVPAYSITPALKGKIASGAIRAVPTDATAVINGILDLNDGAGKVILSSGVAAFAGAAAQGNADAAKDITLAALNHAKLAFVPATSATTAAQQAALKADRTKIQAVAIAVGKSVALVDPNVMTGVAESLFEVTRGASGMPYSAPGQVGEAIRQTLAVDLAKGLATNYAAAGAAVAGVVNKSLAVNPPSGGTPDEVQTNALTQISNIAALAIKASPKAGISIALKIAANASIKSSYASKTSSDLAAALASNPNLAAANAGYVAAGVALADTANTGLITKAVINAPNTVAIFNARQAAALTIANTVAINVDVEAIGLIAKEVGGLLQATKLPSGATNPSKLPKLTTIGTLATSLAKAINTKPLVSWSNRVDELNELAAELTTQYLKNAGVANSGVPDGVDGSATAQTAELKALSSGLASIGTSIFKAASATLLANTFNNAADLKDLAEGVAGALAQVLAKSNLPASTLDFLLNPATSGGTGYLVKLLQTGAKTFSGSVTDAFNAVLATKTAPGAYGTVPGAIVRADGTLGKYEIGVNYETGNLTANETPVKNL